MGLSSALATVLVISCILLLYRAEVENMVEVTMLQFTSEELLVENSSSLFWDFFSSYSILPHSRIRLENSLELGRLLWAARLVIYLILQQEVVSNILGGSF